MAHDTVDRQRPAAGAAMASVNALVAWFLEGLDRRDVWRVLAAGLAAEIVWEIWARMVTPVIIGGPLEPAGLVLSLFRLDYSLYWLGEAIHLVTGFVFYPLGYVLLFRRVLPGDVYVRGAIYGVLLWVFALGICAPLAGLPIFLGFIPLSIMSLIGHTLFGLFAAITYERLRAAG